MNIIIVGCGQVGETLASELGGEGNNITVIDLSSQKINSITARLDVMGVVGNGATHTVQKEAGVRNADLLIAVTDSDELNLLCCMIAKKHSKCRVIARIQNPEYNSDSAYLKNELGLAMVINPEHATAAEISRLLRFPAATQVETFAKGRVELLKFKIPDDSVLVGMSAKDVIAKLRSNVLICTVERGNEAHIVNGDFVFEEKDVISFISSSRSSASFLKKIGYTGKQLGSAMILGAGDTTTYLCDMLRKSGISITVIDKNPAECDELASLYEDVTVICGDQTDQQLLLEEGIERADACIALTDSDEENVLLSLAAKNFGSGKIITKIDKPEYDTLVKHLELDSLIYPKNITADLIARYTRSMKSSIGSNVETVYSFIKGEVEATEFRVNANSQIVDIPLSVLGPRLKKDVLVASILRDKSVIIPHGRDTIQAGDSVVIVSKILGLNDISEIVMVKK